MGAGTGWGGDDGKYRINDTEFAVLRGGPYDGLKLTRFGNGTSSRENQIGLPTPQFIQSRTEQVDEYEADDELIGQNPDVAYRFVEFDTENYAFTGDETIAVYTAVSVKKKYDEVFDSIPPELRKFSSVLNVTLFNFDFYARFKDIDVIE